MEKSWLKKISGSCLHLLFEVSAHSRCSFNATDFFCLFYLQSPLLGTKCIYMAGSVRHDPSPQGAYNLAKETKLEKK